LWRPTSPGNEDVLICINAPYMTQRVLKPWWQWTYQNSAVKRATARAIPGWVTSWEIWYGEPKADNIVSLGVDRYTRDLRSGLDENPIQSIGALPLCHSTTPPLHPRPSATPRSPSLGPTMWTRPLPKPKSTKTHILEQPESASYKKKKRRRKEQKLL
jgi:hypothetical protein